MSYKATNVVRKMKQINMWGALTGLIFVFLLSVLGFYGWTKMQTSRAKKEIEVQQNVLLAKKKEYTELTSDPWYMKYAAANDLENKKQVIAWKDTIGYLIDIYDEVASIDDDRSNITLEDFNVTIDYKVNLRGTVTNIRDMYLPGGLLDRFIAFENIEFITIPFYKRNGDMFEFVLDATIKTYDRFQGSL